MTGLSKTGKTAIVMALTIVAVTGLGCSPGSGQSEGVTAQSRDTIICGHFPVPDGEGGFRQQPEYYLRSAMNRILAYHPEFAAEAGMNSVSDCDSARRFYDAYTQHLAPRPDFDLAVPLDELPEPRYIPSPEGTETSIRDIPKIFNGTESKLNPVISWGFSVPTTAHFFDDSGVGPASGPHRCSGTFIAKHWILTAAHCLEDLALQNSPFSTKEANDWVLYHNYSIHWVGTIDAMGSTTPCCAAGGFHDVPLDITVPAVSIVSPNFIGVTGFRSSDHVSTLLQTPRRVDNDVALLFIQPAFDDVLPNIASSPQTTLYVSTKRDITDTDLQEWTLTDFGFGATFEGAPKNGPLVQTRAFMPPPPTLKLNSTTFFASATPQFASICNGDSGGPVVRQTSDGVRSIVAINSGGLNHVTQDCFTDPTFPAFWSRIDIEQDFIQQTISRFNGNPKSKDPTTGQQVPTPMCTPFLNTLGGPVPEMMQCWAKPCRFHCDCPSAAFFCDNPTRLVVSKPKTICAACPKVNFFGALVSAEDCDCVVGECRLKPDEFPIPTEGTPCSSR